MANMLHVQSQVSSRVTTNTVTRAITGVGTHLYVVQIVVATAANTISSVTDTLGNTYTFLTNASGYSNTTLTPRYEMWYAWNIIGGATTITATESAAGANSKIMYVREFSGIQFDADPLDVQKFGTGSSASPTTGNSSATANKYELVVAGGGDAGNGTSISVGAGYTGFLSSATSPSEIQTEYKFTTATGVQAATFGYDNPAAYALGLASFKAIPESQQKATPNRGLRPHPFSPGLAR